MIPNPTYSSAGIWVPVAAKYLSSTNAGGLANIVYALVPIGASGQYGVAIGGWSFPNPSPATPEPVSMAFLTPTADGSLAFNTQNYISDPTTNGAQSIIVADFNGDGRPDIVFLPYNEHPFLGEPGIAYMSNASGGFDRVIMPGSVNAHDAELTTIDGRSAITTAVFSPSDANPIYTYTGGAWVEHLSAANKALTGASEQVTTFGVGGAYELVRGDMAFTFLGPGQVGDSTIAVYGFNDAALTLSASAQAPIQKITPYLSTLPQYVSYNSQKGVGLTHTYRMWTDDLNHDGHPDILAAETMWNPALNDYPGALQVLINNGDGTFRDATATLNPSMSLNTDLLDYSPTFIDLDHSGINSYLFGQWTDQGAARHGNYLLLNDGTGHLYVALHDQFVQWNTQAQAYLNQAYPGANGTYVTNDPNYFAQFMGVPQADGAVNFVAQFTMAVKDPVTGLFHTEYVFANVPVAYNPTTDFTQDVTVTDRNGSTLMRTWAGNDTFHDANSGPNAHIDGGLGTNSSVYSGTLSQYLLGANADGSDTVTSEVGGIPKVNDTLVRIQTLKFADATISTANLSTVSGWVTFLLRESITGAHAALVDQTAAALTSGADSQAQALNAILLAAENTASVATTAYQFFTGGAPSAGGMDYLVSPTGPNPNNLNSAYFQSFNIENRYINFAVNLGKNGAGAGAFTSAYGNLDLFHATQKAYGVIFGITPSDTKVHALLDPTMTLGGHTMTRADYFASYGGDGAGGIGTKAAMVGWLLAEAVKADVGTYAKSNDAYLTDIALHGAPFGVDVIGHYNQASFAFNGG